MLNLRTWFLLLSLGCFVGIDSREFLYPVASTMKQGQVKIYLLYQKSVEHLELLVWDPVTKGTTKGLLSTFTPGVFKILPDGSGFSFVDKGRILVKSFTKRSPKSVAFYAPLDDIVLIEWLDGSSFYFMAKESQQYAIFQGTSRGDLHVIAKHDNADYMYPQKAGETLFFVRRTKTCEGHQYSIMQSSYPLIPNYSLGVRGGSAAEQMELLKQEEMGNMVPLIKEDDMEVIFNLGEESASFLHMVSEDQGFYIEHPRVIEKWQECIDFSYYQIDKGDDGWERKKLFSFQLPAHFFLEDNEYRLYESLLPFLPRHTSHDIFFTDCYDTKQLKTGIFKYSVEKSTISNVSPEPGADIIGEVFFSPLCLGSMVFYGGMLLSEDFGTGNRLPAIWINDEGLLCADLPCVLNLDHDATAQPEYMPKIT